MERFDHIKNKLFCKGKENKAKDKKTNWGSIFNIYN